MVGMSDKVIIVEATFDEDNENVPANIKFVNTEEAVTEDFPVQELSDQSDVEAGIFNPGLDILLFLTDSHLRQWRTPRCHYIGLVLLLFLLLPSFTQSLPLLRSQH